MFNHYYWKRYPWIIIIFNSKAGVGFLDSTSQIVNLCGVVLGTLRFRESWYIWLLNNMVDLSIWIINAVKSTPNAEMMLITSIMYLIMNVIGLISWIKLERKQKQQL